MLVKKSHFHNKLLTTVSALFVASINSSSLAGTKTINGNTSLNNALNWVPSAPVDNDDILYGGNHTLNANAQDRIIAALNVNGKTPGALTVTNSVTLGGIGSSVVGGGNLPINFASSGQSLTLSGTAGGAILANDYTRLGTIDFKGFNSTLKITANNSNIGANITGNGGAGMGSGTIEINAPNVTLSGVFDNTPQKKLVNINVDSDNNLTADTDLVVSNLIQLKDGANLIIRGGKNVTAYSINSNPNAAFPQIGRIKFEGDSVVNSFIGLGGNSRAGFIEFTTPNSTVQFKKTVLLNQYFTISQNSTAIFADGANFDAAGIFATVNGSGTFTFEGDSDVNTYISDVSTINISGVGKTVTLAGFDIADNVNIADNATAKIKFGGAANDIRGFNSGQATVEFINDRPIVIDSDVGAGNKLKTTKISGHGVELKKNLTTDKIEFTNPNQLAALKLTGNGQIGAIPVTSTSSERLHSIWINSDQDITGNIGTESNPLGTLKILNDNLVKINTVNFYIDVSTAIPQGGRVEFVKAGSFSYSLGDSQYYLRDIKFSENAEVRGTAYSETVNILPGKTAAIRKRTKITDGTIINPYLRTQQGTILQGSGSTLIMGDGATIYNDSASSGDILTAIANQGKVLFEGSAQIRANIGTATTPLSEVEFAANSLDKQIILARDIHANIVKFNHANLVVEIGKTIDGNIIANNTNINFGQHILVATGGVAQFTGDTVFNVYFDNTSNSHLKVTGPGSNINIAGASSLTFNINDNSKPPPKAGRTYNFFYVENGATLTVIDGSKVFINQTLNPFAKWSYTNGLLKQTTNISGGLDEIVRAAGGNINKIPDAIKNIDPDSNSSAGAFLRDLMQIATTDPVRAGQALDKVVQAANPTYEVLISNVNSAQGAVMSARVDGSEQFRFRLAESSGVSAGEEVGKRFGIWTSPFINHATQRRNGDTLGYRSKSVGGSVGFDTMFNDNLMLGIVGTVFNTKINYKGQKLGDTSKIDSILASIYGFQNLSNDWFIQGIASIGRNKVNNSKIRYTSDGDERALGKYTSRSYGTEVRAGYNYSLNNFSQLSPSAGIRYNRFEGDRYQELGTTNQNLSISKKKFDKVEGIIGLKYAMLTEVGKFSLTPQIHLTMNYDFNHKSPAVNIGLDGLSQPIPTKTAKPPRSNYNAGATLNIKADMMEYDIGYDSYFAKKYIAHQGTLKIRVNF